MDRGASSDSSASPIIRPKCTAPALATGRLPGRPRQTAHVCVLGGSPNDTSQPQNIFVRVLSWTWISSPMTGSRLSDTRARSIEFERSLERVRDVEEPVLAECGASDLKADWKPAGQAAGDRDRGDAG